MMRTAIAVLADPASILTKPIAAKVAISSPNISPKKVPDVAPIKNIGVTIPPLPPKLRVMLVNIIFIITHTR